MKKKRHVSQLILIRIGSFKYLRWYAQRYNDFVETVGGEVDDEYCLLLCLRCRYDIYTHTCIFLSWVLVIKDESPLLEKSLFFNEKS